MATKNYACSKCKENYSDKSHIRKCFICSRIICIYCPILVQNLFMNDAICTFCYMDPIKSIVTVKKNLKNKKKLLLNEINIF